MQIGIIGAGYIGRAVAKLAIDAGHQVMVSNSRGPQTLTSLVAALHCQTGSVEQAAAFGDMVLIAVPLHNYQAIPAAALAGKLVLDANNYYPERDGHIAALDQGQTTTSQLLAAHLSASTVVKVFNSIRAPELEHDGRPAGSPGRRALPICGDDDSAKQRVINLLDLLGFDAVDAGPLAQGWRFQNGSPIYCQRYDADQLRQALASVNR